MVGAWDEAKPLTYIRGAKNAEPHNPLGQHVPGELGPMPRLNLLKILPSLYNAPGWGLSSNHEHLGDLSRSVLKQ